jgi:Ca2+-binding RTX toxin-like protein
MLPLKYGTEFQLNSTITGAQSDATVVALADGRFAASWTDASGAIRGRIFNADATPAAADFVIGTAPNVAAGHVNLTALATGGFVASWQEDASGHLAIVAQTFAADGTAGTEFQVAAAATEDRILANVIQLSNGTLQFTYQDQAAVPALLSVTATLTAGGVTLGTEGTVTTLVAGEQSTGIANLTTGRYGVVSATGGVNGDIQLQRFNDDGTPTLIDGVATPYTVNTTTADTQVDAKIVHLLGNDLAVTWTSTEAGGGTDIRARILTIDAGGNVTGGNDFLVHASTAGNEVHSTIAAVADGANGTLTTTGFVVAWLDTADNKIKGQYIDANGVVMTGTQFQVNTGLIDSSTIPQITTLKDGRFVVSWTSATDTDGTGIHAQIFDPRTAGVTIQGSATLGDSLVGTAFDDTIHGNGGDDTLFGGAGADTLFGGAGADHMTGGAGNDIYYIDNLEAGLNPGDTITEVAGGGSDSVYSNSVSIDLGSYANVEDALLFGSVANLSITGTNGANKIFADQNTTANVLTGLDGDDTYVVGALDTIVETATASSGNDTVASALISLDLANYANVENVELTGSLAGLDATGSSGSNILRGDTNSAANMLTGLAGDDIYYVGTGDKIVEAIGGGHDKVFSSEISIDATTADFANIEDIELRGILALSATGNADANVLSGDRNTAANILTGLAGDDTYNVGLGDTVVEAVGGGTDKVITSAISIDATTAAFANIEDIDLRGALALSATGNASDNLLNGENNSAGNQLTGLGGNDTYYVGNGDTVIEAANGGQDSMYSQTASITLAPNVEIGLLFGSVAGLSITGNSGDNFIYGDQNTTANVLAGQDGNDLYVVGLGDTIVETATAASGTDTVASSLIDLDLNLAAFANVENVELRGSATGLDAFGSNSNNILRGDTNSAANTLTGRGGDDTYYVGAGDIVVEAANGGTDTIASGLVNVDLTLLGNVENIQLLNQGNGTGLALSATGNAGNNLIFADGNTAGNALTGRGGDDRYVIGAGDTITELVGGGTDTVLSSKISLSLASFANVENIRLLDASVGATLALNATGNAGANVLEGNSAANKLTGFGGNDTYVIGAGDTVIEAINGGNDTVIAIDVSFDGRTNNVETIDLRGTSIGRNAWGNAGANTLRGDSNAKANILTGLAGDDTYVVGAGDTIVEAAGAAGGNDRVLTSAISIDLMTAAFRNVETIQLDGAVALNALGDNFGNLIYGETNTAANILTGRGGDDRYVVGAGDKIVELAGGGTDTVFSSTISLNLASYAQVENVHIIGTKAGLNATGNAGANTLSGEGNATANILTGLNGDDFYIVGKLDTVKETATGGNDTVASSTISINLGLAAYANVENVQLDGALALSATGTAKANVLNGQNNSAANVLTGLAGDDTYFVGTGDKIIETATGGKDTVVSSTISLDMRLINYANVEQAVLQGTSALNLTGNGASNLLQGNAGNNIIWGGASNDTLIGNAGKDTFVFKTVADSSTTNATRDVITDFEHLVDKIDVSGIDANGAGAGNTPFSFLANKGAAFTGVAGQLHYAANGANTLVEGDTNGDHIADFQLLLVGTKTLTAADFIL